MSNRLLVLLVFTTVALTWACSESRAQKKLDQILASQEDVPLQQVKQQLLELQEAWPDTEAANKSVREVEWIDDLLAASQRGPSLRAWDAVRRVGQAAENFRIDHRRYPDDDASLIPDYLPDHVLDPWGRPVVYERTREGYRVLCFGEDGLPGGSGLSTDIVVDSGERVQVRAAALD